MDEKSDRLLTHLQPCQSQERKAFSSGTVQVQSLTSASPTRILETKVVGGVTLNHLTWASLLSGACLCGRKQ